MSTTNVFDIVHLKFLHKVNILNSEIEDIDPSRRRMRWEADMGEKAAGGLNMEIYVYGINSLRTQGDQGGRPKRSEEHTSELQSLMRISYAVFCLQKKTTA